MGGTFGGATIDALSPDIALAFPITATGDPTSDQSLPSRATLDQPTVTAKLKDQMKESEGWQAAHTAGYQDLAPGIPLVANILLSSVDSLWDLTGLGSVFHPSDIFDFIAGLPILGSIIPGLDTSKIVSGQFGLDMISGLLDSGGKVFTSLLSIPTSIITGLFGGGTILTSLIPGLDTSKIITGTFDLSMITGLLDSGGKVLTSLLAVPNSVLTGLFSGGTILTSLIPGFDASKIISGFFPMSIISGLLGLFGGSSNNTQANNFFTNLLSIFGTPTLTGSTGSFNPVVIPGPNVATTVNAAVVPAIDGSKLATGVVSIPLATSVVVPADQIKAAFAAVINRANTTDISDAGRLAQRFTGNLLKIVSNVATPTVVNASSWSMVTANTPMATNNHYVEVTMSHASAVGDSVALILGSNFADQAYMWAVHANPTFLDVARGQTTYVNFRNAGSGVAQTAAVVNWVAGDVFRFERSGNVYTMKKNGVALAMQGGGTTWTDSNSSFPYLDYQHRDTGVAMQMVTAGHGITTLTSGDL